MTGDEAAIRQALLDYGASFTAFDVARIANHFHDPCTVVTAQGVRALVKPPTARGAPSTSPSRRMAP